MSTEDGKYPVRTRFAAMVKAAEKPGRSALGSQSSAVLFAYDRYPAVGTLAGAATVLTMRYAAIDGSVHTYLNGLELDEGTDYSTVTNSVTLTAGVAAAGDVVVIRYAYLEGTPEVEAGASGEATTVLPRFQIVSNRATLNTVNPDGIIHLPQPTPPSSAQMSFYGQPFGSNIGVGLWFAPNTYLYASFHKSSGMINYGRILPSGGGASNVTLASVFVADPGADFTLKISKAGNVLTAWLNGVALATHTISGADIATFAEAAGVGIVVATPGATTFDNLYADDELVDDFNRPNSPTLGQSSSGRYWVDGT